MKKLERNKPFPQLYEHIEDWPVYKLSQDRKNFVRELSEFTINRLHKTLSKVKLYDTIALTSYMERVRLKEERWKVDPPNEASFWSKIRKKLNTNAEKETEFSQTQLDEMLSQIVKRYANEIVGTFNKKTFQFARRFLTFFFNRLLNTAAGRNLGRIFGSTHQIQERIQVYGNVNNIRNLFDKGTVVVVPTHFSNLDSILVGYAMDTVMGLPSFSYGAGLNLYNNGIPAFFMNRLGAYRVDRRKKNPIYLETLKGMSNIAIQRGVNSLFFPGGTRSRSGMLETELKKGLLGTV
ncbi:MAG: 1-acyl-sn-glycerol-3-phosphate acyltransferase, partial [Saprospiraceae bacterium]|nr:1-acyl-sn-glycerol-3-phosphate acyltransferase [Saprospiraceae bacterium]